MTREREAAGPEGRPRVLLITNIPTPYRIPLFDELNRQLAAAGYAFRVVFGGRGYSLRRWEVDLAACGFDHVVLASRTLPTAGWAAPARFTYGGLYGVIAGYAPDVIVAPGFSIATLKLFLRSLVRPTRYLIWTGSWPHERRPESKARRWQRRLLARRAAGGIAYSSLAHAYLQTLGIHPQNLHVALNTVDTDYFHDETERLRRAGAPTARKHLTYVGYLNRRKNVGALLEVMVYLRRRRSDVVLDVVGDGEERAALEDRAHRSGLADCVTFHGFRQKEALPAFLARSRCFLFQTGFDVWGLVLNEAMAAGVPCLASIHAGATRDLIQEGVNGFAVDFSDAAAVAEKIDWLLDHPSDADAIGRRASRFVAERAGLARSARGFVDAIRQVHAGATPAVAGRSIP